jgi:predicted ferric reductase
MFTVESWPLHTIMSFTSVLHWISSKLSNFDVPSWYAFISGCIFTAWLLLFAIYCVITSEWPLTSTYILKHFIYPHIFPRIPFLGTATRFQVFVAFIYLLANFLIVTIGKRAEMGSRAATMSIANLIPLFCGPRLSLVTKLLGISVRTSIGSHQWFGRTAIAQMSLHTIISLIGSKAFTWTTSNLTGVVVCPASAPVRRQLIMSQQAGSAFGFILLLSIRLVRRALYEWFLNSHLILSVVVFIALWRHISSQKPAEVFLRIGVGLWAIATALHWVWFAFRNVAYGRKFARARVTQPADQYKPDKSLVDTSNVLQVDITVPRPWRVKAGEFVFLSIPKLGIFTGLRGHPFMVSWWERDLKGLTISLLVKSRAGFTAELSKHLNKSLLAFVDGPYGTDHGFGEYGTVIMLATGIGIASHMPFIKDLVNGYNNCEVKTRRIRLVWQIKEKCEWHTSLSDSNLCLNQT